MKRVGLVSAMVALAINGLGVISPHAYAAAQTCAWTGTGGDSKFSTAGNWSNCNSAAPTDGDTLVFDTGVLSAHATLTNDISSLSLAGITFTGTTKDYSYTIDGSALTVTGPIASTATYNSYPIMGMTLNAPLMLGGDVSVSNVDLYGAISVAGHSLALSSGLPCGMNLAGAISGAGAVTFDTAVDSGINVRSDNSGFTGSYTANDGARVGFYTTDSIGQAASLNATNAKVFVGLGEASHTLATSLNMSGTLYTSYWYGVAAACGGATAPAPSSNLNLTLSGGLNLGGDLVYSGDFVDAAVTGSYTANGHSTTVKSGSTGSITLPSGTIEVQPVTTTYSDTNASGYITVGNKQTAILDGVRRFVSVDYGGILSGTGTITEGLAVGQGGSVAPGHSPGCLTSDTLALSGEYQFELGGSTPCSEYDQLIVKNAANSTGAVTIDNTSATLKTSRYNNYTPKQGDEFIIIDQAGDKAVSGTFMGLPEGATFTQNGIVFKISYVGGDGNDVTLTVQNSPTAPDTGVQILKSNPALVAVATIASAVVLLGLAKRARR